MRRCSGGGGRGQKVPIWRNVSRETSPGWVPVYQRTQRSSAKSAFLQPRSRGDRGRRYTSSGQNIRPRVQNTDRLFADAEVPENHVQDILDIDPAGEAPKRAGGDAQLLRQQILAGGDFAALGPAQGGQDVLKRVAVARAGHQRGLRPGQEPLGVARQLGQKVVKTLACDG